MLDFILFLTDVFLPIQDYYFIAKPFVRHLNLSLCIRNNPPIDNIDSRLITSSSKEILVISNRTSGPPDEIFCFTYLIQLLEEKDYGNYTLILSNSVRGSKLFTFQVICPLAPSPPINVSVVCNVSTANLNWTAGSAGDAPSKLLSFILLYKEEGTILPSTNKSFFNQSTQQINDVLKEGTFLLNGSELNHFSFDLTGLVSKKVYVFELYSYYSINAIGRKSEPSQRVKCSTSNTISNGANIIMIIFILLIK